MRLQILFDQWIVIMNFYCIFAGKYNNNAYVTLQKRTYK